MPLLLHAQINAISENSFYDMGSSYMLPCKPSILQATALFTPTCARVCCL